MTDRELAQAAKDYCADPEKIKAMNERAKEAEKRFEQEAKAKRPDKTFWERVYDS